MNTFMPLSPQFWGAIEPDETVDFVVSFPRSGSRWLIVTFNYLIEATRQTNPSNTHSSTATLPTHAILNGYDCSNLQGAKHHSDLIPTPIVRSHNLSQIIERDTHKILYLYRDPSAILPSYFHYASTELTPPITRSFKKFHADQIKKWTQHMELAIDYQHSHPGKLHFLKYQDDGPFTLDQIEQAVRFFGLSFEHTHMLTAITRLKQNLEEMNASGQSPYTRGANKGAEQHFKKKELAQLRAQTSGLLERADAIERQQAIQTLQPSLY